MKFSLLLCALSALLFLPHPSLRAEDAPPNTPAPAASVPVPASPAPAAETPPVARKEEEEPRAWSLSNLSAYLKTKKTLGADIASRDHRIAQLEARVRDLESGTALKALQAENAQMRTDLEAMAEYAQTHGLLAASPSAPPAPASPAGQAAGQAIAAAVSTQLAALGIPAAAVPAATGNQGTPTLETIEAELKACKTPTERQEILSKHHAFIIKSN